MAKSDESGMWNLVMFDLPVLTKQQRHDANKFRLLLIDLGWQRAQLSVYVRYVPTGMSVIREIMKMRSSLPDEGRVEIVAITDRQWAKAVRFINASETGQDAAPELLSLF